MTEKTIRVLKARILKVGSIITNTMEEKNYVGWDFRFDTEGKGVCMEYKTNNNNITSLDFICGYTPEELKDIYKECGERELSEEEQIKYQKS
jgi:hypothetical protein